MSPALQSILLDADAAAAAPAFSPLSLTGLLTWYDAADSATLFQESTFTTPATADTHPVGGWKDKSGNLNHATRASDTTRPILKLAIQNGKPSVRFDGSNDVLGLASNITAQSIFAVVKKLSGTGNLAIMTTANWLLYASIAGVDQWSIFGGAGVSSGNNVNTMALLGYVAPTPTNHTFSHNSVETTSATNISTLGVAASWLGCNQGSAQFSNIDLCELITGSGVWDATQRASIVSYLNAKWAVF